MVTVNSMGLISRHPRAARLVPVVIVLVAGLFAGWLVGGGGVAPAAVSELLTTPGSALLLSLEIAKLTLVARLSVRALILPVECSLRAYPRRTAA